MVYSKIAIESMEPTCNPINLMVDLHISYTKMNERSNMQENETKYFFSHMQNTLLNSFFLASYKFLQYNSHF
jgi:hypothetical protein